MAASSSVRPRHGAWQHDEWLTMGKRCLSRGSMTRLLGGIPGTTITELLKERLPV